MGLAIFRVAYNYCLPDSKGKTTAMKLGLAKAPVSLEDILYFSAKGPDQRASSKEEGPRPCG